MVEGANVWLVRCYNYRNLLSELHSTLFTSVVVTILLLEVMYDATGVRLHVGRQALLLNQIVCEHPPEHLSPMLDLFVIPLGILAAGKRRIKHFSNPHLSLYSGHLITAQQVAFGLLPTFYLNFCFVM